MELDQELRKKIEETYELSKQNNEILHKMRRAAFWSHVFRGVYWVIIVGAAFGAYYFIQPYVDAVLGTYGKILGHNDEGTKEPSFWSSLFGGGGEETPKE